MPAYKDEKTGKWFAKFYYTNWQGIKKQKWKRGFATKKEALGFERDLKGIFWKSSLPILT